MLWAFFQKGTFGHFVFRRSPLFAAFARKWGDEKKGEGEKQFAGFARADLNILVAADGRSPMPRWVNQWANSPNYHYCPKPQRPGFWAGRGDSTIVESSLQIDLFLQNKANFAKSQVALKFDISRDYGRKSNWTLGENKPNSKPIWEQKSEVWCRKFRYVSSAFCVLQSVFCHLFIARRWGSQEAQMIVDLVVWGW